MERSDALRALTSAAPEDQLGKLARLGAREPVELADAVREFEGYFAGEMLRFAGKSEGGVLDGGHGARLYRDLFFEELGRIAMRSGGLGLASSLSENAAPVEPRSAAASKPEEAE